ncbi:MAG: hypothetical protein AMJ81_00965 [Phycisphaerae bacterium SM23_33]|jgi:uncharacterized repeat protein (TIGR04138 family)|nr:MAG: hypothetical protein AMJ81_00965 [Phycisphaerae bacterium SM23_33]
MSDEPKKPLEELIREDGRYPLEAFVFLHEGLARAAKQVYGEEAESGGAHHVTGKQLCQSLREQALERWGLLAGAVLRRWNIRSTFDFGQMVYLLVENRHMKKTEEDSVEDFRDVYDFEEVFGPEQVFGSQQ